MSEAQQVIQKDSERRIEEFKKGYMELTKKFECDFISFPQYVPSEQEHGFRTTTSMMVIDKRKIAKESPYQEIIKK